MRILVTGGAGFIGSHLVDAIRARGEQVTVLDDFSTGRRENLPPADPNLAIVRGSVCDEALVRELVGTSDLVYHLAAAVGVGLVRQRRVESFATNVRGTESVLQAAAPRRIPVVVTSSSEVYGDDEPPFREDQPLRGGRPDRPRAGYACGKTYAECSAFAHAAESGLPVLVVRLFNTAGRRQRARYGMVLPRFVDQALAGRPLTVFGDGSQSRCFAHVSEVVEAVLGLVERQRFGEIFNVGSSREVTIRQLAESVLAATGSSSSIERVSFEVAHPGFCAGPRRRVPDLGKLRAALGWVPERAVDAIVRDVSADRCGRGAGELIRG